MNCSGCCYRTVYHEGNECTWTLSGVKDILGCPCKECLIKMMCKYACSNFDEVYSNNQNKFRVALYKKGWIKKGWIKSNT